MIKCPTLLHFFVLQLLTEASEKQGNSGGEFSSLLNVYYRKTTVKFWYKYD